MRTEIRSSRDSGGLGARRLEKQQVGLGGNVVTTLIVGFEQRPAGGSHVCRDPSYPLRQPHFVHRSNSREIVTLSDRSKTKDKALQ